MQGSSIVETLRARYPTAKIAVLTRNPTTNRFPGVDYHKGDITRPLDIQACINACHPTVVFHCAATVVGTRKHVPDSMVQAINVDGTRLLLDACRDLGLVKAFVFTSSVSVVQKPGVIIDGADETWDMIDTTLDIQTAIYPRTKAEAERLVSAADDGGEGKMRTASLRPTVIYGERDNDVTPIIMRTLWSKGLQIGGNTNPWSTTYVGNSTHAHLLAAEKLCSDDKAVRDRVGGQAFFIANEGTYTYCDFARTIWYYAGVGPKRDDAEYDPKNGKMRVVSVGLAMWVAWASEWFAWATGGAPIVTQVAVGIFTMVRRYDISKAKERLGYREQMDWEEGCRRSAQWWRENRGEDGKSK